MLVLSSFIILIALLYHVQGLCKSVDNYSVLGELKNQFNGNIECEKDDFCSYVSMNIPGLAIGSFSGCSYEVLRTLANLRYERLDILDPINKLVNHSYNDQSFVNLCERSFNDPILHSFDTMTGKGKIVIRCYKQEDLYVKPLLQFFPPPVSASPVKCVTDNGLKECTEGYCGVIEMSSISKYEKSQVYKKIQDCPSNLISSLYVMSLMGAYTRHNDDLLDNLKNIGPICINKKKRNMLSINGLSSYYWHINCYIPTNDNTPSVPDLLTFVHMNATKNQIPKTANNNNSVPINDTELIKNKSPLDSKTTTFKNSTIFNNISKEKEELQILLCFTVLITSTLFVSIIII